MAAHRAAKASSRRTGLAAVSGVLALGLGGCFNGPSGLDLFENLDEPSPDAPIAVAPQVSCGQSPGEPFSGKTKMAKQIGVFSRGAKKATWQPWTSGQRL